MIERQPVFNSEAGEFHGAVHPKAFQDLSAVELYRLHGPAELGGNLLITQALGQKAENLHLPGR
jgi:hypothetical protein